MKRIVVACGAVGASTAVIAGGAAVTTASAAESNPSANATTTFLTVPAARAGAPVKAPTATLTKAQKIALAKATIKKRYGIYPLPVSQRTIKKYHLSKKQLRGIAAGKRLASTSKARQVLRCESGGNYRLVDGAYYGAWQFDIGTWNGNGGGRFASNAARAPKWAQDYILWKTHQARGWSPWSCA